MSGYMVSRLALLLQAEGLALAASAVGVLCWCALAASYVRHYASPDRVPIRLWVPVPDDLPRRPSPLRVMYGASDLKARYRRFMGGGVTGAAAIHVAAIGFMVILSALAPEPVLYERIIPVCRLMPVPPPTVILPEEDYGVSWGKAPTGPMPSPSPPTITNPVPVPDTPRNLLSRFDANSMGPGLTLADGPGIWDAPIGSPIGGPKDPWQAVAPPIESDDTFFQPVETLPVLVSMAEPAYPPLAREQALEGDVTVRALVGRDGRVQDVRIRNPIPLLEDAAKAAARTAVFKPAYWNRTPVRVWVEFTIKFRLD